MLEKQDCKKLTRWNTEKACRPPTNLVSGSAGFTSPLTRSTLIAFEATFSWIHKSRTSKCLKRPSPFRLTIAAAAVASVNKVIFTSATPKSPSRDWKPIDYTAPLITACNSASADESAMVACVELHDFINEPKYVKVPPLVDRRDSLHPAQSLSVYVAMSVRHFQPPNNATPSRHLAK